MTDRERLIEILKLGSCPSPYLCDENCKYANLERCYEERTADLLLEHGVIVLSCKVGDTVYIKGKPVKISFFHIENEITYCVQLDCEKLDCFSCPFYEDEVSWEIEHDCGTYGYREFTEREIGKTVFLTREEAEKALKKGYKTNG